MIVDVKVLQVCIDLFNGCCLEHLLREVNSGDLLEASGGQLLADEAGPTADIQNAAGGLVEASSLCVLLRLLGGLRRVREADPIVDAVVISGQVIEVPPRIDLFVPIAELNFLDERRRE